MGDFEENFIQGQEIEVGNDDEGFQGSWYAAKVVQTPLTMKEKVLVEYTTLMGNVDGSKPLQEYVDTYIVRPRPPQEEERFFEQGELVEAYHNDGWWEGTIIQVHDNLSYRVRLRALIEDLEFLQSEIRRHHEWIAGRWAGDQELQTIDSSFCVGASVEVCLDDENYRDAWFPAVILNRINNSSFLVEYQTSRFLNMTGKINETVDLLHIRPFPPNTSQDKSFDLLEKVDAFYDRGWWSGVINRVLAGSKYIVFLKHRHEQKEFSHSELRFHMDWIDGKLFMNSKEISPQGQIEAPGQVKSGEAGKTDQKIEMGSRCGEGAAKNVAVANSPGQVPFGDAGKTDQNIEMASQCGEDAAKDVAVEKSAGQVKSADAGKTDHNIHLTYTINSCKTPTKMQSISGGDTDSIITREKRKSMQSTPENVTKSIITREKRKKMQSTPENNTNCIITREKRKKMQSTPEAVKTTLAPIACRGRAMATRVLLTETDGQLDFKTQTTKGQGANIGGEGYKDHPKDLNSGQEQLKHVLESNRSRNQSSVEDSPHLPQNIINVEQYEVVNLPRTQEPARPMKLRIRPTRQKGEPLALDDIKQETSKGGSKQTSSVSDRKTKAMVSITKALVKDVEHSGTVGRPQVPVLTSTDVQSKGGDHNAEGESSQAIETQTKGLEQTTPSKEIINYVVHREDATKETDMDWALSDIGDLHQPPIHYLKDSPIRGSELQISLDADVSSFSFGGTTANTLLDQAIGDEVSERIQQSFLICSRADQMVQEDESFPFIKCSPVWETVESLEIFRIMPQRLHFSPVKLLQMDLREGHAIGSMVNFATIVEKVRRATLDDPQSILQSWFEALENLKGYGFNVQPIKARLQTLLRIKDELAKLNKEVKEAEDQLNVEVVKKISVEAKLDEQNKKIRELQEPLNQLIKKQEQTVLEKEAHDSSITVLKKTIDNAKECILSVTSEFRTVFGTPW